MTTEVKATAVQMEEDDFREIIRSEMSEGASRRFRWDGTVNLGHLLTGLGMVGALFLTYSAFDKRLALVETQLVRQTEMLDRSIRADEQLRAVRDRLDRLERPR